MKFSCTYSSVGSAIVMFILKSLVGVLLCVVFFLFVELFKQVKTCIATLYKLKETKTFSLLRSKPAYYDYRLRDYRRSSTL